MSEPLTNFTGTALYLGTMIPYALLRGGGVETAIKEDKQGLGITKRNKKRFKAQQMMAQLNALAHNLIVWSRRWLAQTWDKIENFYLADGTRCVPSVWPVLD